MLTDPVALGRLDVGSGDVTSVGALASRAEFTGNANGELWGFFPDEGAKIIRVDTATGSSSKILNLTGLPSLENAYGYAFAFADWGGAFYVFYHVDPVDESSNVYRVTMDGEVSLYIPTPAFASVAPAYRPARRLTCLDSSNSSRIV